ncbi:MAG: TIGR02147 family protein [Bdellovibrionota bacterium]
MEENNKPSIFKYIDFREYLKEFYTWKKSQGSFSHATFAERAGFKSRSYLRLALTGKRNLSSDAIVRFIHGLELNKLEAQAFTTLVAFNQATTTDSKKYYWETFIQLQPKNEKLERIIDEYKYISQYIHPVLMVLLRQRHIKKDVDSIANTLEVKKELIQECLKNLVDLGFVTQLGDQTYSASEIIIKTTTHVRSLAIQNYHKDVLEKSISALQLPIEEREFQSNIIALGKEEYDFLRTKIRNFMYEINDMFSKHRKTNEKIYALNLNLVPITKSFIQSESVLSQKGSKKSEDFNEQTI